MSLADVEMVSSGATPEELAQQRAQFGARARELHDRLIGPLREVARAHGYALATHGSVSRDIDLIACPWTAEATDAQAVYDAVMRKCADILYGMEELPHSGLGRVRAHGRMGGVIHLGGGPYIDLAIMPREVRHA